uniref:Apoptosis and caspase activation inhibitor n=1 Tax=Latimeria chalumnae TaxID=7897 RepID=H3AL95_LATCH
VLTTVGTMQNAFLGDSFTQFRFTDEKEWEADVLGSKQTSALFVDCQSLAQSLQELPIYLRLNLDAELIQVSIPVELPQMKPKSKTDGKSEIRQFRGSAVKAAVPSSQSINNISHPDSAPTTTTGEPVTQTPGPAICLPSPQQADDLDEELDLLLSLENPVTNARDTFLPEVISIEEGKPSQRVSAIKVEEPEKMDPAADLQQTAPKKQVTEEELEDWLDSMIT